MAEKRNCPVCGKDWYSADTVGVWKCECGAKIPPPKEKGDRSHENQGQLRGIEERSGV